jgi:hypothetical protein
VLCGFWTAPPTLPFVGLLLVFTQDMEEEGMVTLVEERERKEDDYFKLLSI